MIVVMGGLGPPGNLALARWAGWSAGWVGRKCPRGRMS